VERGPRAFAQFRLQESTSISIIEDRGDIVACMVWSQTNTVVNRTPMSVMYASALRVRADRRREGLGDLVRRYPLRALQKPALAQVMYRRTGNAGVEGFINGVKFREGLPRPTLSASMVHLSARPTSENAKVRPATESDLDRCVQMINRTHDGLDLFQPQSVESLRLALSAGLWGKYPIWVQHVYDWRDFYVLEHDGEVLACAGLWDRGRDIRERWRSASGEERVVEAGALLDFGCKEGNERALADLIRSLAHKSALAGRQDFLAPILHLPAVLAELADLEPHIEFRTLEWSAGPTTPSLGETFSDLRYW